MSNGLITIRKATIEDIPFLRAMMWEAIIASPHLVAEHGIETMQQFEDDYWRSWDECHDPSFVALDSDGKKLGIITLKPNDTEGSARGWRLGIGVDTEARGQGIGQRLIEQAIAFARESGADYMNLHVDSANTRAITLYQRLGFVQQHKRRGIT